MPTISYFFGIMIAMYAEDHNPAHFHVRYNEYKAIFGIDTIEMLAGYLPNRVVSLVIEWANEHHEELKENWKLCKQKELPFKISPLE